MKYKEKPNKKEKIRFSIYTRIISDYQLEKGVFTKTVKSTYKYNDKVTKKVIDEYYCLYEEKLIGTIGETEVEKSVFSTDMKLLEYCGWGNLKSDKPGKEVLFWLINPEKVYQNVELDSLAIEGIKKALQDLSSIGNPTIQANVKVLLKKFEDLIESEKETNRPTYLKYEENENLRGIEWLENLYKDIREQRALTIKYKEFNGKIHLHSFIPYLIEQVNNRWYLIGESMEFNQTKFKGNAHLINLPLDRIVDVQFNHRLPYFRNEELLRIYQGKRKFVVGIKLPYGKNSQPHEFKLKVKQSYIGYLDTKPLPLQRIDKENNFVYFKAYENKELLAKLLSMQDNIEIVEPKSFRKTFLKTINSMVNKHQNN
jgi:predicted DNA-binding transcriptional regulator YafY